MSIFRAYFFDLDTRQELTDHPLNGKQWLGTDANVKDANGKYVDGTTTAVEIARHASLRSVKDIRRVTAADFPGQRIAVKVWHGPGQKPDWRKLLPKEQAP
jgi:hypothetical protein